MFTIGQERDLSIGQVRDREDGQASDERLRLLADAALAREDVW
jgi:hypothetical protein